MKRDLLDVIHRIVIDKERMFRGIWLTQFDLYKVVFLWKTDTYISARCFCVSGVIYSNKCLIKLSLKSVLLFLNVDLEYE